MSVRIGVLELPRKGGISVDASLGGIEVESTIVANSHTLEPHEALNLAMLLTRAVSEVRHMRQYESDVGALVEALEWCGGSSDFQEGGVARAGWLRVVKPLLDAHHQANRRGK